MGEVTAAFALELAGAGQRCRRESFLKVKRGSVCAMMKGNREVALYDVDYELRG